MAKNDLYGFLPVTIKQDVVNQLQEEIINSNTAFRLAEKEFNKSVLTLKLTYSHKYEESNATRLDYLVEFDVLSDEDYKNAFLKLCNLHAEHERLVNKLSNYLRFGEFISE